MKTHYIQNRESIEEEIDLIQDYILSATDEKVVEIHRQRLVNLQSQYVLAFYEFRERNYYSISSK